MTSTHPPGPVDASIVLLSGGVDSAVLLAAESRRGYAYPLYVSNGFAWEHAELRMLEALLAAPVFRARVAPLTRVALDMRTIYTPGHWAVTGAPPAYDTPDADVYLPGRNVVLLTQAAVMGANVGSHRIAIASLAANPFPDATPQFFAEFSRALSTAFARPIDVVAPLADLQKEEVLLLGQTLGVPFESTLSCMMPALHDILPVHCGLCSKCRERRDAFEAAGIRDPAAYLHPAPR